MLNGLLGVLSSNFVDLLCISNKFGLYLSKFYCFCFFASECRLFFNQEKLRESPIPHSEEALRAPSPREVFKNVRTVRHEEIITLEKVCSLPNIGLFSLMEFAKQDTVRFSIHALYQFY